MPTYASVRYEGLYDGVDVRVREGGGLPAGRPVDTIRLRVIEDRWGTPLGTLDASDFEGMTCSPGVPGEVVVSGAHVLPGYLDGKGDTETKFDVVGKDGAHTRWHRTGDAGTRDADGRLWLLGRCAAAVRPVARGAIVEEQVAPHVERAGVIGQFDHLARGVRRQRFLDARHVGARRGVVLGRG